jgi:hypothetical protein
MSLYVTDHAVERFIHRWRPGVSKEEALVELQEIVQEATPTRKRTLTGDADLYVAMSPAGERIAFAVREKTIITVLPGNGEGQNLRDCSADEEHVEESRATIEACQAMLAAEAKVLAEQQAAQARALAKKEAEEQAKKTIERFGPNLAKEVEASRRRNAEALLRDWKAGKKQPKPKVLRNAHNVLGLPFVEPVLDAVQESRVHNAKRVVADWRSGVSNASAKAVEKAHKVLGLPFFNRRGSP